MIRFALLSVLLACCFATAQAREVITLGKSNGAMGTIAEAVLREAYRRVGIELAIKEFPAERALNEANRGILDGELSRMAGIEARYPDLVRIPVAINRIEGMVYTNRADFRVDGWDSLRPYLIGVRIGIKFAEDGTHGMRVQRVPTNEQLFSKLELGRTDIVVSTRTEGEAMIRRLKTRHVRALEPPLLTIDLFHYLHRKNQDLVPRLTDTLRQMEREGRIRAIQQDALAELRKK